MAAGQHRLEHPVGIALAAVGAFGVGVVDPAQDKQPRAAVKPEKQAVLLKELGWPQP
jgi:hypothetical protein